MEQAVTVSRNENATVSTGSGLAWAVGFFFAFRLFIMILSVWVLGTDPQTGVAICLVLNFAMLGLVVFSGFRALLEACTPTSCRTHCVGKLPAAVALAPFGHRIGSGIVPAPNARPELVAANASAVPLTCCIK